ncbi:MAG: hypothetical protein RIT15_533, partial [Pseudomonadota bacterium]
MLASMSSDSPIRVPVIKTVALLGCLFCCVIGAAQPRHLAKA